MSRILVVVAKMKKNEKSPSRTTLLLAHHFLPKRLGEIPCPRTQPNLCAGPDPRGINENSHASTTVVLKLAIKAELANY